MVKLNVDNYSLEERASDEIIKNQIKILSNEKVFLDTLNNIGFPAFILNKTRQIIFINNKALEFLHKEDMLDVIRKRPGEILNCINSTITGKGCGTSQACLYCGALNAIYSSIVYKEKKTNEADITTINNNALKAVSLIINSAYINLNGNEYILITFSDNDSEKRNKLMQRVFFHDLINVTGGLSGMIEFITPSLPDDLKEHGEIIENGFKEMLELIYAQKQLIEAENGDLKTEKKQIVLYDLIQYLVKLYKNHPVAKNRYIELLNCNDIIIKSDFTILGRIIGNMIKNALEASKLNETVTIWTVDIEDKIKICVHNQGIIPEEVKDRIFQRSASTKGKGRGLGTYSMKLFGEKYLEGQVGFESKIDTGTIFYIILNK